MDTTGESGQPPTRPWNVPPPPPTAPLVPAPVDVKVSKRLLWIDGAAYPLQNVARVFTFTLTPRRKEAILLFLRRLVLIVAGLALGTTFLSIMGALTDSEGANSAVSFFWLIGFAAFIYSVSELVPVLQAKPQFVLAVETSGPSIALVTSRNHDQLRQLVGQIAHAIENPETEFKVTVERITISPNNYYFGDNVNMYGGSGNTGVSK